VLTPFFSACYTIVLTIHVAGCRRRGRFLSRRTVLDFCIVGPSAIGSVKGIPSSIKSVEASVISTSPSIVSSLLTSATRFHPKHDIGSLFWSRVSRGHIRDQSGLEEVSATLSCLKPCLGMELDSYPLLLLALCECLFNSLHCGLVEKNGFQLTL